MTFYCNRCTQLLVAHRRNVGTKSLIPVRSADAVNWAALGYFWRQFGGNFHVDMATGKRRRTWLLQVSINRCPSNDQRSDRHRHAFIITTTQVVLSADCKLEIIRWKTTGRSGQMLEFNVAWHYQGRNFVSNSGGDTLTSLCWVPSHPVLSPLLQPPLSLAFPILSSHENPNRGGGKLWHVPLFPEISKFYYNTF